MKKARATFTGRALRELRAIRRWIADGGGAERADRVIARIVTTADLLAERPLLGPERPDVSAGLRSFVVWPYVIFYQPRGTGARIMRVVHGRQDVGRAFRAPNGDNI